MSSREALSSVGSQGDTSQSCLQRVRCCTQFPFLSGDTPSSSTEVSGPFEVRLFHLMVQDDEDNECVLHEHIPDRNVWLLLRPPGASHWPHSHSSFGTLLGTWISPHSDESSLKLFGFYFSKHSKKHGAVRVTPPWMLVFDRGRGPSSAMSEPGPLHSGRLHTAPDSELARCNATLGGT